MQDKGKDNFFDERPEGETPRDQLMSMIEAQEKVVKTDFEPGMRVSGTVVRVGSEYVFLDVGGKHEAILALSEVSDASGEVQVKAGDTLEAYIVSVDNGELIISKSLSGKKASNQDLIDAMNASLPVEGKITGVNKGGFNVSVMGKRAFCPVSHIDLKFVEDPNQFLGRTYTFAITRITDGGRNVVVSRLPLLEKDLDAKLDELESAIEEKKVLTGAVSRITKFGLFVDLGEIEGLVHISEVSWDRAEKLEDSFHVGQKIECIVLKIERKKQLRDSRISLSIKQAFEDPWSDISEKFTPNQQVRGTITRLANFGAFVQLLPGVEGLIHVSEMRWGQRVRHPSDVVSEGEEVTVTILAVDAAKRSISCSLKDITDDPWQSISEKFPVGAVVAGTVASETRYGFFIDLAEGITGLLPHGNVAADKKGSIKAGNTIEVTIENVDTDARRMSLSYGVAQAHADKQAAREYLQKQSGKKQSQQPSSEFGEMLKAALSKKKK
jgi:small subunit ribosomal protein S1